MTPIEWLNLKVSEKSGVIELALTANGNIGVFKNDELLGLGETVEEACQDAMAEL